MSEDRPLYGTLCYRNRDQLIRIPLTKGCYLLLTPWEYRNGITRGKAQRRRLKRKKRIEKAIKSDGTR
jgi:hypothetical protein